MTTTTECPRCHRKSEIVPLNIVCPFCIASDAAKAERERIRQKLVSLSWQECNEGKDAIRIINEIRELLTTP